MLDKLFEESDHLSPEVLEELATVLFNAYSDDFANNPSPRVCAEFLEVMPRIAAHKRLIGPLAQALFDWNDIYIGFGMAREWDRLVKSVSARVIRDLGFEEGWDLLGELHLKRLVSSSINGNQYAMANAFQIALDFGVPERDLLTKIELINALINSHSYAELMQYAEDVGQYFEEAMSESDLTLQLRALVMMARFESAMGNHARAFELAQQGILVAHQQEGVSLALSLLAVLILPYLESNTRRPYLEKVFTYWDRNIPEDNLFGRALFDGNYGVFLLRQKEYATARQYLENAALFYHVSGWERNLGRLLLSLGVACGYEGDFAAAEEAFLRALDIYEALEISDHIAMTYHNLGWMHTLMGNDTKAITYLEIALNEIEGLPDSAWKTNMGNEIKKDLGKVI